MDIYDKMLFLLALSRIEGIGRTVLHTVRNLEEFPVRLPAYPVEKIQKTLQVSQRLAKRVKEEFSLSAAEKVFLYLHNKGGDVLLYEDPRYPLYLREIYDPPEILYGIGDFNQLSIPGIGVVGSRTPTPYGKKVSYSFAKGLTEAGFTVISGLAKGIDGEAHRGALAGTGATIGVLGCGIDQVYPELNRRLYEEVATQGLLLSEYPPGMPPDKGFFPERNRIISGLSLGVIVVESAMHSGSHITAQSALDQGREVFAVPGSIFSSRSAGCHHLVQKSGAKLIQGLQDVLQDFLHLFPNRYVSYPANDSIIEQLTLEEAEIMEWMGWEPVSFEKISQRFPFPSSQLHHLLLSLQVKKCIERLPGPSFLRIKE